MTVPRTPLGPDCRDGKHPACDGRAIDEASDTIVDCTCSCHPAPTTTRQAMILDFADGHREYSPDVEVTNRGRGDFTIKPNIPFTRIPGGT